MSWQTFLKDINIFATGKNAIKYIKLKKESIGESSLLNKHLIWTNLSISVLLSGLGDIFIQHYEIDRQHKQENVKSSNDNFKATNKLR